MQGNNYLKIQAKNFDERPSRFWIGLTDFLHEREKNRSGWRWSDGSINPKSSELTWGASEPSKPSADCITQDGSVISGASCVMRFVPMCQMRALPNSSARSGYFQQRTPVFEGPREVFAQNGACTKLLSNVKSKIECAAVCMRERRTGCVSFFYSEGKERCRLVLFTDATIRRSKFEDWEVFAMT